MEGFDSTSFGIGGKLIAIPAAAIQQLSTGGITWEIAGHLENPRFFARLLPSAATAV